MTYHEGDNRQGYCLTFKGFWKNGWSPKAKQRVTGQNFQTSMNPESQIVSLSPEGLVICFILPP